MGLTTLPQRIELVVWTTSTRLMKKSPLAAQTVVFSHDLYYWLKDHKRAYKLILMALSGFCAGFMIGLVYIGLM